MILTYALQQSHCIAYSFDTVHNQVHHSAQKGGKTFVSLTFHFHCSY